MDVVLHQRETADAAVADLIFVVELATLSQTFAQLLADAAVDVVLHQRETADAAVAVDYLAEAEDCYPAFAAATQNSL